MKATEFCYWLQGYFEIGARDEGMTAAQADMIKRHLAMVFLHDIDKTYPAEQQKALNKLHGSSAAPSQPVMRC